MCAQELRISSIARNIKGNTDSVYRMISRFLDDFEIFEEIIPRILLSSARFVIGDPTIIEKKYARKTTYVCYVRPEKKGYYLLTFGAPFKGRTIPFGIHTYSPATIAEDCSSRNIEHTRGLAEIVEIIGDLPVIFDREFSYGGLLKDFEAEKTHFVIRLNQGNKVKLYDQNHNEVELSIGYGKRKIWKNLLYKNEIKVNVAACWMKGFNNPLFVITNLDNASEAIDLYLERMKIEQSFKDLKDKLGIHKCMSKKYINLKKMLVIAMLAYMLLCISGETIRDEYFPQKKKDKYSGVHIMLYSPDYGFLIDLIAMRKLILEFFQREIWLLYRPPTTI